MSTPFCVYYRDVTAFFGTINGTLFRAFGTKEMPAKRALQHMNNFTCFGGTRLGTISGTLLRQTLKPQRVSLWKSQIFLSNAREPLQ